MSELILHLLLCFERVAYRAGKSQERRFPRTVYPQSVQGNCRKEDFPAPSIRELYWEIVGKKISPPFLRPNHMGKR